MIHHFVLFTEMFVNFMDQVVLEEKGKLIIFPGHMTIDWEYTCLYLILNISNFTTYIDSVNVQIHVFLKQSAYLHKFSELKLIIKTTAMVILQTPKRATTPHAHFTVHTKCCMIHTKPCTVYTKQFLHRSHIPFYVYMYQHASRPAVWNFDKIMYSQFIFIRPWHW